MFSVVFLHLEFDLLFLIIIHLIKNFMNVGDIMTDFERNALLSLISYVGYLVFLVKLYQYASHLDRPVSESNKDRDEVRQEFLRTLETSEDSRDIIRMRPNAFRRLVSILRGRGLLRDSQYSTTEEQLVKFLHTIGCNVRNRTVKIFFCPSSETVSRHFHQVLRAIITLEDQFLVQPNGSIVPLEIQRERRYYPYFKVCFIKLQQSLISCLCLKMITLM